MITPSGRPVEYTSFCTHQGAWPPPSQKLRISPEHSTIPQPAGHDNTEWKPVEYTSFCAHQGACPPPSQRSNKHASTQSRVEGNLPLGQWKSVPVPKHADHVSRPVKD